VSIQELLNELDDPPEYEIGQRALEFNDDVEIFGDMVYVKISSKKENAVLLGIWVASGTIWIISLFVKIRGTGK
jgi:hypothetical protein